MYFDKIIKYVFFINFIGVLVEIRNVFVSIVLSLFLFNSHAVTGRFGFEIGLPFGFFINGRKVFLSDFRGGSLGVLRRIFQLEDCPCCEITLRLPPTKEQIEKISNSRFFQDMHNFDPEVAERILAMFGCWREDIGHEARRFLASLLEKMRQEGVINSEDISAFNF